MFVRFHIHGDLGRLKFMVVHNYLFLDGFLLTVQYDLITNQKVTVTDCPVNLEADYEICYSLSIIVQREITNGTIFICNSYNKYTCRQ